MKVLRSILYALNYIV